MVVPEPAGHFCFCVDYRRLKERKVTNVCQFPRMDDRLDSLSVATVFSTLDCSCGYWKIPVDADDKK